MIRPMGSCEICKKVTISPIHLINIIQKVKVPVKSGLVHICEECLNTKEFLYYGKDGIVKINIITPGIPKGSIMKELH